MAGMPAHVVQRGNNRQAVFYDEQHHRAYLRGLKRDHSAMARPSTLMCL